VSEEGVAGLFAGIAGSLTGVVSTNFAYFYCYNLVRTFYMEKVQEQRRAEHRHRAQPGRHRRRAGADLHNPHLGRQHATTDAAEARAEIRARDREGGYRWTRRRRWSVERYPRQHGLGREPRHYIRCI